MRVPSGERELVRAGAAGDPAAAAALWDAYGPRVFAFCRRVLGRADAAADAAQDAFLLAHAELGGLARSGESFGLAVFSAARTTCYELLGREQRAVGARRGPAPSLSGAAAALRPQQRAALALAGLEGLGYAEIATVLGIGAEGVGALLARARLRLHDELHGTALAAAAVRSPDCEDVVPLLAAGADGELSAADAGWADPHVTSCPTCPRTRRAIEETAATYAAWSPAVPPTWLAAATLAELGTAAPAAAVPAPAGGAAAGPRPRLSAALLGACLLSVAFAALLLTATGSLRQRDPASGGVRLPDAARSVRVAGVPPETAARPAPRAARTRAPHHAHRARPRRRPQSVVFVPARAVRRVTSVPQAPAAPRPAARRRRPQVPRPRPKPAPARRPSSAPPAPAAPTTTVVPTAPTPANPAAPADELPGGGAVGTGGTTAVPASATPPPAATTTTTAPAALPGATDGGGQDHHDSGGRHQSARPCPSPRRCRHGACRH